MTHTHRRRSVRLRNYDYTQAGAYFVTACTHDRICLFGDIVDGEMHPNEMGRLVAEEWVRTAGIRKAVDLDAWVVMPNHFHGVLMLKDSASTQRSFARDADEGTARRAPTDLGRSGYIDTTEHFGRPVTGSLPTIMRAYKSATTRRVNQWRRTPGATLWQRNYHEHVIRNEADLERIRAYVASNPAKWELDSLHPARFVIAEPRAPAAEAEAGRVGTRRAVPLEAIEGLTSFIKWFPAPFDKHVECPGPKSQRDKAVLRKRGVGEPESMLLHRRRQRRGA